MLNHERGFERYFRPPNGLVFQIIVVCSFGVILGVASLRLSPLSVLGALVATLLVYVTLKRHELALLGILIATSSIVFENQLPMISVGISFHIPDFLLLGSLGIIVVRWLVEPKFKIVRTPLDWPLLIFYGITLLSTFVALNESSLDIVVARRMIRIISYYLTFFIVTNLVRDCRQLNFLLNGLFLLATLVAAAMVAQFLLGNSVQILPGRVESLWTQGTTYDDITRINPPGWSIVLVSFVPILCILVLEKSAISRWLEFVQCSLLGLAILFTFLRSYWSVLIMVLFLLFFIFRGYERQRLIGWSLLCITLVTILLLIISSQPNSRAARLVDASVHRLSTLGNSGTFQGEDSSLNWRMLENRYAFSSIASHPWIGLGLGATYRPYDPRIDVRGVTYDFRKHIHNGHLWILLNTGLLGYLAFLWLSFTFLIQGFRYWRSITNDRMKEVVLGFTLVYLAVLVAAVVNSTTVQWRWTPVIGIIMGINQVILKGVGQERSVQ